MLQYCISCRHDWPWAGLSGGPHVLERSTSTPLRVDMLASTDIQMFLQFLNSSVLSHLHAFGLQGHTAVLTASLRS